MSPEEKEDLAAPAPAVSDLSPESAAEPEELPIPHGRWQFPLLGVSLFVGALAWAWLWATTPTLSDIEEKWNRRVSRAMDRGDVEEAFQLWTQWDAVQPQAGLARKWPRRIFTILVNKLKVQPNNRAMAEMTIAACQRALAVETESDVLQELKRARTQMWMDLRNFDKAAQGFAELGDLGGQVRALSLGGRPQEAAELVDVILHSADASLADQIDAITLKLPVLMDHKDWSGVLELAARSASIAKLPGSVRGPLALAEAEALFEVARTEQEAARQERMRRALSLLESPEAESLMRGNFRAFHLKGEIAYALGCFHRKEERADDVPKYFDQAMAAFERALAVRREAGHVPPEMEGTLKMRIGDTWVRRGDEAKAISFYREGFSAGFTALSEGETVLNTLVEVFDNLDQMSRRSRREKLWREAIEAKSMLASHAPAKERGRHALELADYYTDRAEEAMAAGRAVEADEDYLRSALVCRDFLESAPFAPEYLNVMWRISSHLKGIGDLPEAADVMREFLEQGRTHPRYGDALFELGAILKTLGDYGEAIAVFERNIMHYEQTRSNLAAFRETGTPRSVYLSRLNLGEALLVRGKPGDIERAVSAFQGNLRDDGIDPASAVWRESLHGLGRAFGRMADAVGEADPVKKIGFLKQAGQTWDHYLRRYARYAEPIPDSAQVQDYREGRALYRQALREKGWIEAGLGRWNQVVADWEQYVRLGDAPPEGALAFLFAEAYHRLGRSGEAEALYLRMALSENDPFKANALYRLGDLHWKAGRLDHAREAYRRAVEQSEAADRQSPLAPGVAHMARLREAQIGSASGTR